MILEMTVERFARLVSVLKIVIDVSIIVYVSKFMVCCLHAYLSLLLVCKLSYIKCRPNECGTFMLQVFRCVL